MKSTSGGDLSESRSYPNIPISKYREAYEHFTGFSLKDPSFINNDGWSFLTSPIFKYRCIITMAYTPDKDPVDVKVEVCPRFRDGIIGDKSQVFKDLEKILGVESDSEELVIS